jgi:DNA-binding GntR family transcriptional regulator
MPVPDRRDAVARQLLRDTAYTALREAIVSGTLAPGESLRDRELCEWLGLSRTPVRAALVHLRDDGLVEMKPQRYTRVTALRAGDMQTLFPLLAALHALATELAVPRIGPPALATLRRENQSYIDALRASDPVAAYAADERFHDVFVTAAANPEIGRALERVAPRARRAVRLLAGALPGRRSVAQHQAVMSCTARGDATGAAAATRENWLTLGAMLERAASRAA